MTTPSDPMPEQGATPPPVPEGAVPPPPPAGAVPPPAYSAPPPGYQAPPPGYAAPVAPLSDSDQRMWAMLAHLGGILWFLPSLIIWLVFKGRGRFVEEQAKEALNFQILMTIVYVIGIITSWLIFGIFILIAGGIAALIFIIMAAIAVNKGEAYRYPVNVRLIK